jgi:hypothetical protein
MSPRPEILKPEYLQGLEGPAMVMTAVRVQRLIETSVYIQDAPQSAIIDKMVPLTLSGGILFRGMSLIEFTNQAIHEGLLPYNPHNPRNPIFLHKGFGVDTSFNKNTEMLTVSRAGKPDLSVRFHKEDPGPYNWSIMEAVAGLAVIPDGFWDDIRNKGLVVGKLTGDYYDKTWRIESSKGILLPQLEGVSSTPALARVDIDEMGRMIKSPKAKRLMTYQPVAILADLRTGK